MDVNKLMAELERRHPGESEYLQAVREVLTTVEETYYVRIITIILIKAVSYLNS